MLTIEVLERLRKEFPSRPMMVLWLSLIHISERELRAIVKGRINWLFHSSDEHADRACAVFSLIASCEMHGLDPELYLQEILTVGPNYPVRDILDLSPKNWVATRQRLIAEGTIMGG